ncbi:hypothetical protein A0256_23185 [Mucilaginibacter sp. PAMC 26640]|nr:hypothetical protein A0256_23185 [Mucilaginibacter sp. PAMC 26640]
MSTNKLQQPGDKVKYLFFNLYRCQRIFRLEGLSKLKTAAFESPMPGDHVELRSTTELTEQEYENVAQLTYNSNLSTATCGKHSLLNDIPKGHYRLSATVSDYLRAIGILIPFTYLDENNNPITLTPADIVQLGWAVVK